MYKHILVPVDFSEFSKRALKKAIAVAKVWNAELTLLHVVHEDGYFTTFLSESEFEEIKKKVVPSVNERFSQCEKELLVGAGVKYSFVIRYGAPYAEIIMELNQGDYDLVVVGSHGVTGLKGLFPYGSTAEKVVRRSPVDVWVVKFSD